MPGIIVSDTSCLILLKKLGKLEILESLFKKITVTQIIAQEFGKELPDFIEIEDPNNKNYQRILETYLDPGEASAIALALEKEKCLLILDDNKARKEAKQLNLTFTGTIGIIIVAKEKGLLDSINDLVNEIRESDFRISESLLEEMIRKSNE